MQVGFLNVVILVLVETCISLLHVMQAKKTQIFPNITWSYIDNFRLERAMNQVSEEPEDDNVNDRGDLEARPYQVFFLFFI